MYDRYVELCLEWGVIGIMYLYRVDDCEWVDECERACNWVCGCELELDCDCCCDCDSEWDGDRACDCV